MPFAPVTRALSLCACGACGREPRGGTCVGAGGGGAGAGAATVTVTACLSVRSGVPPSPTTTRKLYEPGACSAAGFHVKAPVVGSISAPAGAPSSEYVNVIPSMSCARAVKVTVEPASASRSPIGSSTGGSLTGRTTIVVSLVSERLRTSGSETPSVRVTIPYASAAGVKTAPWRSAVTSARLPLNVRRSAAEPSPSSKLRPPRRGIVSVPELTERATRTAVAVRSGSTTDIAWPPAERSTRATSSSVTRPETSLPVGRSFTSPTRTTSDCTSASEPSEALTKTS